MTIGRNRPLTSTDVDSKDIGSLYEEVHPEPVSQPHHRLEGLPKLFHTIPFRFYQVATPFFNVEPEQMENTTPSPLMEEPGGLMLRPPALPEWTEPGARWAYRRNRVQQLET